MCFFHIVGLSKINDKIKQCTNTHVIIISHTFKNYLKKTLLKLEQQFVLYNYVLYFTHISKVLSTNKLNITLNKVKKVY